MGGESKIRRSEIRLIGRLLPIATVKVYEAFWNDFRTNIKN